VTLDGKPGTQIHSGYADLQGWQVLFKFPAVDQAGVVKLKATVKNDQQSTVAGIDYKIVNDLTVATVWENLTKKYLLAIPADLQRYNDNNKGLNMLPRVVYLNGVESEPYLRSNFTDDYPPVLSDRAPRIFIPGLKGYYNLTYNGDVLSQIRVTHFEILNTVNFTGEKFYNELESVFGKPTSTKNTALEVVTTYNYPGFVIETHLDKQLMYTLITKK
jgi:hypothetical protein